MAHEWVREMICLSCARYKRAGCEKCGEPETLQERVRRSIQKLGIELSTPLEEIECGKISQSALDREMLRLKALEGAARRKMRKKIKNMLHIRSPYVQAGVENKRIRAGLWGKAA